MGFTRNPDRNIGLIVTFVLIYGALGAYAMPWAIERYSINVVLAFFAIFVAIAVPLVRFIPDSAASEPAGAIAGEVFTATVKALTILAVFLFGIAVTMVWAFVILVGTNGGLEEQTAGNVLGNANFIGIAGAFLATVLGKRYGRVVPMSAGILGCGLGTAILLADVTYLTYSIAVFVYSLFWNFVQPYLMAILADFRDGGKTVVRGIALQMIAYAIGPYLGALLVRTGERHVYDAVNLIGAILFVLSLIAMVPGLVSQRRAASRKLQTQPQLEEARPVSS